MSAQCEELEKQVMLERMDAQIVSLQQEIQALQARSLKHGRKLGSIAARTRKQRLADREAIAAKQAELTKLEAAHAKLSGIPTVTELHPITRNQFLKMVGMSVLATAVWNRAMAREYVVDIGSSCVSLCSSSMFSSCSQTPLDDDPFSDADFVGTPDNNYSERSLSKDQYARFPRPDVAPVAIGALIVAGVVGYGVKLVLDEGLSIVKGWFKKKVIVDHEKIQKMIHDTGFITGELDATTSGITVINNGGTKTPDDTPLQIVWGSGKVTIYSQEEVTNRRSGKKITITPKMDEWDWTPN